MVSSLPDVEWKAPRIEVAEGITHFKLENGALWADTTQQVNLVAGGVYRLSVEAEPQLRHGGNPANDPLSGEIAVIAGNLVWRGTDVFPNNVWTPLVVNVTAVGTGPARLGWSVRLRHQLDQNWYHLRLPKLEVVSLPTPPPGGGSNPPPTTAAFDRLQKLTTGLAYTISNAEDLTAAARLELQVIQAEIARLKAEMS